MTCFIINLIHFLDFEVNYTDSQTYTVEMLRQHAKTLCNVKKYLNGRTIIDMLSFQYWPPFLGNYLIMPNIKSIDEFYHA